ncbi:MAG: tetratricopeptide repeat protein [Simkania sp.]|nr:tetratricopeptide repeat protein [Simkania sp.]
MKKILCFCSLILLCSSCQRNTGELQPKISHAVQDNYLKYLPSPFPRLSDNEKAQDWGKEYTIGLGFAHQLDLYQAMTAFKRAEILAPSSESRRVQELRYDILLCYYLGQKYPAVAYEFEHGTLRNVSQEFPAFHDLLVILYDTYIKMDEEPKAQALLQTIGYEYPETAQRLAISTALIQANFSELKKLSEEPPPSGELQEFLEAYKKHRKSPGTAQTLNAVLPGAGYLYLGQRQSALTALLLNALFIGATYHFYDHHQIAAGTIFLSFEFGWYFGGIFGAGLEAKAYNERIYEELATPMMNYHSLFPVLNLRYAF